MVDRRPVKCMVVDDDGVGAEVVGEFLETLGAEVRVVYGGQQAIDLAPHFQPRMVVLDLSMPTIDGFETCKRLRQQAWSHNAVIIAYTGLTALKAIVIAAGFDYIVLKGDGILPHCHSTGDADAHFAENVQSTAHMPRCRTR